MKKQHLILLALFYISNSFSQEKNIEFGIKFGANNTISSISESDYIKFDSEIGLNFGAFMNYPVSSKIALRPELLYSTQNLAVKAELFNTTGQTLDLNKSTQKETYINLPVLIKYNFTEKFSILLGPQIGYIINNDDRIILEGRIRIFDKAKDRLNFSSNIGLSFKINEKIETELRYNLGLTELNGFKNSVLQLNFGYIIW